MAPKTMPTSAAMIGMLTPFDGFVTQQSEPSLRTARDI
jgi:hypothetical protein